MKIAFVYLLLAVHTVFSTAHPDFARRKRTTYPYLSSVNGLPSNGIGGHLIPDPSDTAHQFIAPGPNDIRGPCPGINMAANYGFLSRDGRTTMNELLSASQNLWNIGFDLATFLVAIQFAFSGNLLTGKMTIGRPDLNYASIGLGLLQPRVGSSFQNHGGFEQDTSFSREDLGISGNAMDFNGTTFRRTAEKCEQVSGGNFDRACMKEVKWQEYQYSIANNPSFVFGPLQLINFGTHVFLYTIFMSTAPANIKTIIGAQEQSDGSYIGVPERLPAGWHNRVVPLTVPEGLDEIAQLLLSHPFIFGANTGRVNSFVPLNLGNMIVNGVWQGTTGNDLACLLKYVLSTNTPSLLGPTLNLLGDVTSFLGSTVLPILDQFTCPT